MNGFRFKGPKKLYMKQVDALKLNRKNRDYSKILNPKRQLKKGTFFIFTMFSTFLPEFN